MTDLNFLRNFRTAGSIIRSITTLYLNRCHRSQTPYYNRSHHLINGINFTAPIVPQSTPARVSFGPTVLMTGYSLAFTPERMRGFATHSLTNNISDTNQTILISESILMLANLQAIQLWLFIKIITTTIMQWFWVITLQTVLCDAISTNQKSFTLQISISNKLKCSSNSVAFYRFPLNPVAFFRFVPTFSESEDYHAHQPRWSLRAQNVDIALHRRCIKIKPHRKWSVQ